MTTTNLDFIVSLTDKIESGELDSHLQILRQAVDKRIEEKRGSLKLSDFLIGDKVRINERCGTKYLVGETAQIVGIRRSKITVMLDNPTGRFARKSGNGETISAEVIVPIAIVDKI